MSLLRVPIFVLILSLIGVGMLMAQSQRVGDSDVAYPEAPKSVVCGVDTVSMLVAVEYKVGLSQDQYHYIARQNSMWQSLDPSGELDRSRIFYYPIRQSLEYAELIPAFEACNLDVSLLSPAQEVIEKDTIANAIDQSSTRLLLVRECVPIVDSCDADVWCLYKVFAVRLVVQHLGLVPLLGRTRGYLREYYFDRGRVDVELDYVANVLEFKSVP